MGLVARYRLPSQNFLRVRPIDIYHQILCSSLQLEEEEDVLQLEINLVELFDVAYPSECLLPFHLPMYTDTDLIKHTYITTCKPSVQIMSQK